MAELTAMDGWTGTRLDIATLGGPVTIDARTHAAAPGLAIHPDRITDECIVTHTRSGCRVGRADTMKEAAALALMYAGCGDWTRSIAEIAADRAMLEAARGNRPLEDAKARELAKMGKKLVRASLEALG